MADDTPRRRRMARIGELIPDAAAQLGLLDELRRARATATFEAVVAEHAPAVHGACRSLGVTDGLLHVEADAPIVAQELRLHELALVEAFRAAPGGGPVAGLRVTLRRR